MATLRNKRKLTAVSRETPEGSRISRWRNVLDPELTHDYISQVSKEIEGRVTKKLSKEFNETESRILGALSKLDEFLLNPQVRTCSVAVQGTSETLIQETGKFMWIAPRTIPILKWGIFLITLANTRAQRQKPTCTWWPKIILTWWQELQKRFVTTLTRWQQLKRRFPTAPLKLRQANERRRALQVKLNFAVRIPLRQLKQTRFCWPFNNWQRTPIQPISTTILAETRNCQNLSQRRCLRLTDIQRNLSCLRICSKRVWKSTISWRKKTRLTTSTLACVWMLYRLSKTSLAPTERIWEKSWLCSVESKWNPSQWLRQNTSFNG